MCPIQATPQRQPLMPTQPFSAGMRTKELSSTHQWQGEQKETIKNDLILPHCMAKYRRTKLQWHRGGVRKGAGGQGGRTGRWGVRGGIGRAGSKPTPAGWRPWAERGGDRIYWAWVSTVGIRPQCALNCRGTPFLIHTPHVKMHKVCQGLCRLIHILHEKRCSRRIYAAPIPCYTKKKTHTLKPTFPENRYEYLR